MRPRYFQTNVLSQFNFTNCNSYDVKLNFFLKSGFITMLYNIDINILTDSISAKEKNLAL